MVPVQFLLVKEGIITEIFAVAHDANLTRISPTWISPTIVYSIWYDYSFACKRSVDIERADFFYKSGINVKKKGQLLIYGGNNSGVRVTGEADICLDPISKFSTRAISVAAAVMSTQVLYMRTKRTEKRTSEENAVLLLTEAVAESECVLIKRNFLYWIQSNWKLDAKFMKQQTSKTTRFFTNLK